jgi:hypothetical protein
MSEPVKGSEGAALLALYRFLNGPVQAGPQWVKYRRAGVDAAISVVQDLMKLHGFEFKPHEQEEAK